MGSGRWVNRSKKNHPDFAWYPYVGRSANPEVNYGVVQNLLRGSPPVFPTPESEPRPETDPVPQPRPEIDPTPEPQPEPEPTPPPGIARVKALVTLRPLAITGLTWSAFQTVGQAATSDQDDPPPVRPVAFRWNPTQQAQIHQLLHRYHRTRSVDPEWLEGLDPKRLLGPFAQDEVVIYVEPKGGLPKPGPAGEQNNH